MDDDELLKQIVCHGGRLLLAVQHQHEQTFDPVSEDPRWHFPWPLSFDLQHRYLMTTALDAFDVTIGTLQKRASQQAFGAIRFVAEALATARWLCEPPGGSERQRRAYCLVLGGIKRTQNLIRNAPTGDPSAASAGAQAAQMKEELMRVAREDGFTSLSASPDRRWLFTSYMPEMGYALFALLSELGSHPGPFGVLFYAMDPKSKVIDFSYTGAVPERAYWASMAYHLFTSLCAELGAVRGWHAWLDTEGVSLLDEASPLLLEAGRRWEARRGLAKENDSAADCRPLNHDVLRGTATSPRTIAFKVLRKRSDRNEFSWVRTQSLGPDDANPCAQVNLGGVIPQAVQHRAAGLAQKGFSSLPCRFVLVYGHTDIVSRAHPIPHFCAVLHSDDFPFVIAI
jgi:hypothetical protein